MPDAAAGEPIHHADAKALGCLCRLNEMGSGTLTHALRITIAIDGGWQDLLVAWIDVVAHCLTDKVSRNGVALETRRFELCAFFVAVCLIGLFHLKVVAPAGQFNAIVAEGLGFLKNRVRGHVCPLASEESDGSSHNQIKVEFEVGFRCTFCARDCLSGGRIGNQKHWHSLAWVGKPMVCGWAVPRLTLQEHRKARRRGPARLESRTPTLPRSLSSYNDSFCRNPGKDRSESRMPL